MKKIALVLSGGGAKGAFQYGAVKYIEEVVKKKFPGFDYSVIAGVSVGSLNGGMLAMKKYDAMKTLWNTISDNKVYSGNTTFQIVLRIITGHKSALSNKPLTKVLAEHFHLKDVSPDYDYRIGVVTLPSGAYKSVSPSHFSNDADFQKAVLASTSIPVIWEPVPCFTFSDGLEMQSVVDGGLRNVSPLGDVLDDNPDLVVIINCSSPTLSYDQKAGESLLKIAKRSLSDITINQIFNQDVEQFLKVNNLVLQAKKQGAKLRKSDGTKYKHFKAIIIQPSVDMGDTLDFSQPTVQMRISAGFDAAKHAFSQFDPEIKHSDETI